MKPKRAKFSLEMMSWTPPDGPDEYLRLMRAVDRPAFGVHVDVCNIINNTQRFFQNGELISGTFQKLGKWVLSCHAEDLWGYRVHLAETVPGRGVIDYAAYLRSIAAYAPNAPLMLEQLSKAEECEEEAEQYVLRIGQKAGVSFT